MSHLWFRNKKNNTRNMDGKAKFRIGISRDQTNKMEKKVQDPHACTYRFPMYYEARPSTLYVSPLSLFFYLMGKVFAVNIYCESSGENRKKLPIDLLEIFARFPVWQSVVFLPFVFFLRGTIDDIVESAIAACSRLHHFKTIPAINE